eukprot:10911877-Alexandrium_andersonii.AAC.1
MLHVRWGSSMHISASGAPSSHAALPLLPASRSGAVTSPPSSRAAPKRPQQSDNNTFGSFTQL